MIGIIKMDTRKFLLILFGAFAAAGIIMGIVFLCFPVFPPIALLFPLIFFLIGAGGLIPVIMNIVTEKDLVANGRQVRARVVSVVPNINVAINGEMPNIVKLQNISDPSAIYVVKTYMGDPNIMNNEYTVYVSEKNPNKYKVEL